MIAPVNQEGRSSPSVFISDFVYLPVAFAGLEPLVTDPDASWLDRMAGPQGRREPGREEAVPVGLAGRHENRSNRVIMPLGRGLDLTRPLTAVTAFPARWQERGVVVPIEWRPVRLESLIPVLEADLELSALDGTTSRLGVNGVYKAPLGRLGLRLDRMAMRRLAESTIRGFLQDLSEVLQLPGASS